MIKGQESGSLISLGGNTFNNIPTLQTSTQHNEYSITGLPTLPNKPTPSVLDMNGQVPSYNYLSNLPT